MLTFLKKLFSFLLDCLYPTFCCHCHRLGPFLCSNCYEHLQFYSAPIRLSSLTFEECYLDQLIAAVEYKPIMSTVIRYLKYQNVIAIGSYLGQFLYDTTNFPAADLITAVPLHPIRQKERGFNQAVEIAKQLATASHIPYQNTLLRVKRTENQAQMISRQKRLINLTGIFAIDPTLNCSLAKQHILLIDDVCTTGATLNECAKVLKENGALSVVGVVVAHGL